MLPHWWGAAAEQLCIMTAEGAHTEKIIGDGEWSSTQPKHTTPPKLAVNEAGTDMMGIWLRGVLAFAGYCLQPAQDVTHIHLYAKLRLGLGETKEAAVERSRLRKW